MGYHIDSEREQDLREAYDGPVVSAAPGYSLLDEKLPDGEPQHIIAWRIGRSWTLPVTTLGCMVGEHYVIQPDGGPVLQGLRFGRAGAMGKLGRLEVMAGGRTETSRNATRIGRRRHN